MNTETGETSDTLNIYHCDNKEYILTYTIDKIVNSDNKEYILTYTVDKIVNRDSEKVSSSEINYYRTIDQVFENLDLPTDFTGTKIYRNNDGFVSKTVQYVDGKANGLTTIWSSYSMQLFGKTLRTRFKFREEMYVNGILQGICTQFFRNGKIHMRGNYEKHKKYGQWISYYENGKIESISNYINGKANGEFKAFWTNGRIHSEGMYVAGKQEDEWRRYDWHGEIISEGMYSNDQKCGIWKEKEFSNWRLNCVYKRGCYKNDKKDGIWIGYYDKNCIKKIYEGKYKNGKREGMWSFWHKNGKPSEQGKFKKYIKEGE